MTSRLLLVGGGLANSLIAYRIAATRPEIEVVVLERGSSLGGNHTWSFHDGDLTAAQRQWMEPLVAHSWPRHELRFPKFRRVIESAYHTVNSERLHRVVTRALGDRVRLDQDVVELAPGGVRLADGGAIEADAVIDGRGPAASPHLAVGFQKFLGIFLRLEKNHELKGPVLMDATVDQNDGFRFLYTLPLAERELLVEDTFYSDGPTLDRDAIRQAILAYADRQGWRVAEVLRDEEGVLPIVLGGDIEAYWAEGTAGIPRSGMRAALFHPTTGYSLPEAVRLADELGGGREISSRELHRWIRERSIRLWRRNRFLRLLNRMLYRAAEPELRYRVLERFYGLPDALIHRFYAGRLSWRDKLRLVSGTPPVPVGRALRCLAGDGATARERPRGQGA